MKNVLLRITERVNDGDFIYTQKKSKNINTANKMLQKIYKSLSRMTDRDLIFLQYNNVIEITCLSGKSKFITKIEYFGI